MKFKYIDNIVVLRGLLKEVTKLSKKHGTKSERSIALKSLAATLDILIKQMAQNDKK
jgi:hypothetical protein